MIQTLELINGKWKWCDNPMLDEAMKQAHILQEEEEIEYSVVTDEEKQRAVPVIDIIKQVCLEFGLEFNEEEFRESGK